MFCVYRELKQIESVFESDEMHLESLYFTMTRYLLHISAHLSYHQREPSTRENMREKTSAYPHWNA